MDKRIAEVLVAARAVIAAATVCLVVGCAGGACCRDRGVSISTSHAEKPAQHESVAVVVATTQGMDHLTLFRILTVLDLAGLHPSSSGSGKYSVMVPSVESEGARAILERDGSAHRYRAMSAGANRWTTPPEFDEVIHISSPIKRAMEAKDAHPALAAFWDGHGPQLLLRSKASIVARVGILARPQLDREGRETKGYELWFLPPDGADAEPAVYQTFARGGEWYNLRCSLGSL